MIDLATLIFYSVARFKHANRRQHIENVEARLFVSQSATRYKIKKELARLVQDGAIKESRENQYKGWRYSIVQKIHDDDVFIFEETVINRVEDAIRDWHKTHKRETE